MTAQPDAAALLQRIAPALQEARQQLEAMRRRSHEPIAILGIGLRFPGADSPQAFWKMLRDGVDAVTEVPADRWDVDDYYDPQPGRPGKMYIREAAFVEGVDQFDAEFFDISRREAASLDPQHRMLLEVSWEALERAGVAPDRLLDSQTGVFMGMSENDYARLENTGDRYNVYATTGNSNYFAGGRLSYLLGLQGPNLLVDTACSSSLVAVHLACQSLRLGECELALAGGVQLMLTPDPMIATAQLNAFAKDGRCKAFDASADGYGRGEGCGVIVLKRLSDAQKDGDPILAVIRGSAVNHGGRSSGLTTPNKLAQEALLKQALQNARVQPEAISYVEAHGTGTQLGDPIEVGALTSVFGPARSKPLWMGSVKTNIGHLEPASGIAGLIKVVLALQENQLPPSLHFKTPSPFIDWEASPARVPTQCIPWDEKERTAGVSSFGMSGTNCHVILGEAPERPVATADGLPARSWQLLLLSAKSEAALAALVARYRACLPELSDVSLADLCHSANLGRSQLSHRLAIVSSSVAQLSELLKSYPEQSSSHLHPHVVADNQLSPRIGFLFTGQGSQYPDMGRELFDTQPTFRKTLERCDAILRPLLGESILEILYPRPRGAGPVPDAARIDQTCYTQPALFALEYALAELWKSWGVEPDVVLGHSVGEYVAACLAGVFSLDDGLKLIAARGRLMQRLPSGSMLSVSCTEQKAAAIIAPYRADVSIAAVNGPQSIVISGKTSVLHALSQTFAADGIKTVPLIVSHAFHSPMMAPMLTAFRELAATVRFSPPRLPLVSNVTGTLATDDVASPDYWVQHVREAVRFADGLATLQAQPVDILLEVGPKPILLGLASQNLAERTVTEAPLLLSSLHRAGRDWQHLLVSAAQLVARGVRLDLSALGGTRPRQTLMLPTYPFQRSRYWVDAPVLTRSQVAETLRLPVSPLTRLPLENKVIFEREFSLQQLPFLEDHKIMGEVVVPGACFVSLMFEVAQTLLPPGVHEVKDVVFHQPIVLGAHDRRVVQAILTLAEPSYPNGDPSSDAFSFQIVSFPADGPLNESPALHATGALTGSQVPPSPGVELAALQRRCPRRISQSHWYRHLVQSGILLGPSFGWIDELWRGEDMYLGRLRRPRGMHGLQGNPLHLALLDSCLIVADDFDDDRAVTRLPIALDSVRLCQPATGDEWWCLAQKVHDGKYDFQLMDKTGQVVAEVAGFADKEAPEARLFGRVGQSQQEQTKNWPMPQPGAASLWQKRVALPSERKLLFETECSLALQPHFADLQIFGQAIVPVSYSVSLLMNAANAMFSEPTHALTELVFQRPLPINPGEVHTLQALFDLEPLFDGVSTQGDGADDGTQDVPFQLLSFQNSGASDDVPLVYGIGKLGRRTGRQTSFLSIDELLSRCSQSATFDDWYPWVSKKGYGLGPYFYQWIDGLWRGENETLTRLRLPDKVEVEGGNRLYFALFHSCIMATNLLFLQEDRVVRTPYSIDAMHLFGPATGDEWWCYAQRIGRSKYNFQLLNARGMVLAEVLGYTEREVLHPETFFETSESSQWLYQMDWQPLARHQTTPSSSFASERDSMDPGMREIGTQAPVQCLILSHGSGQTDSLEARLAARGLSTWVLALKDLREVGADRTTDNGHSRSATLDALFRTLPDLKHVVYLGRETEAPDLLPMAEALDACSAVLQLVRSLLGAYGRPPSLLLVTRGSQRVLEGDRVDGLAQSSLWGFARSLMAEHPELACVCMDVEALASQARVADRVAEQLLKHEPSAQRAETQLAWRGDQAYAARLTRHRRPSRSVAEADAVEIRGDGAYLVTGGRSGVGLEVAKWLVEQGARHLVLVGRSQPNAETRQVLEGLEKAGAEILSPLVDVSDADAMAGLLDSLKVPLRGVIHAAGILDDAAVLQLSPSRFEKVLLPKVQGAWHLHRLTGGLSLDFFLLFSSAASLLGARGQANYAAANAFLDGLACHRRSRGLPGLALNWGAWAEVGMAARSGVLAKLPQSGEEAIPVQKGLELLGKLLREPAAQIGILPIQWARFLEQHGGGRPFFERVLNPGRKSASTHASKKAGNTAELLSVLAQAAAQDRPGLLDTHLRTVLAQLIGMDLERLPVDDDTGFIALGLDSLTSIELRNTLQRSLGCSLPVTFAFDHPTLKAALQYLTAVVLTPMSASGLQAAAVTTGQAHEAASTDEGESLSAMLEKLSSYLD